MSTSMETQVRTPWTYGRKVGPIARPVTVDQVKRAIRLSVDDNSHDEYLLGLIDAAAGQVEHDTSIALMTQTWVLGRDDFNRRYRFMEIPLRPISAINSIKYIDGDGNQQTMPSADYRLDAQRSQIVLEHDKSWPENVREQVEVEFVAGYGDDARLVPAELKTALIMQVGKWFQNPTMDMSESQSDKPYEALVGRYMRSDYP